ncbi:hypothetical protein H1_50 [Efunavirus H1]|uniref:Holin n=1 Tax=Enterococcus phage H1 TaxID=2982918 RepID=A0AAE9T852_9CAUD|nr:hypothetical protein H1_50 [Enterococcus phage H1]
MASIDMSQIQDVFAALVAFGGILAPIVFYIIQLIKPFIPSDYTKLIAVVLGGAIGAVLVAIAPALGIVGLNYIIGVIGGLIGGYIATNQFDTAAKKGFEKGLDETKTEK